MRYLEGIAKLFVLPSLILKRDEHSTIMPRLKGFRYPREIIAYGVWAYHRFALSTADVEDLLAEWGVIVSRETVRLRANRFGKHFVNCIKRDRPRPSDKWHMDEVVITIRGKKHRLWRAIDANGDVLVFATVTTVFVA